MGEVICTVLITYYWFTAYGRGYLYYVWITYYWFTAYGRGYLYYVLITYYWFTAYGRGYLYYVWIVSAYTCTVHVHVDQMTCFLLNFRMLVCFELHVHIEGCLLLWICHKCHLICCQKHLISFYQTE